jgi:integrase
MIVTLTPAFISTQLIVPAGKKREEFCDSVCRGLVLLVSLTAEPVWKYRYKRNGTTTYDTLGTLKELTLTQARKLASQKKAEHAPFAKRAPAQQIALGEMSLEVFMSEHYMPYAKNHKRSWLRDDQLYRIRIAPKFGHLPLKSVSRYDVQKFHNELSTEGLSPASADHHVKLMRRVLNLAVQWDMLEKNVLKNIPLLMVDNQVENYLKEDQLVRLVEVLRTDANRPVCHILMFLLSTGARLNEAIQAKWSQVDTENAVWRIPATNSKSKRTRSVPLNDSALWVLEQAALQGKFDCIFANPETGKPFVTITRIWYRLRKQVGIEHLRIHDLRHSFASMLVSGGRSLYEVQQILGHSDPKVTMRYAHLSTKALQEAASSASVFVPKAKPEQEAGVVSKEVAPETTSAQIFQLPKAA